MNVPGAVDLGQLEQELRAAGVTFTALGGTRGEVFTYNEDGQLIELPDAARSVLDAHTAKPRRTRRAEAIEALIVAKTIADLKLALIAYLGDG